MALNTAAVASALETLVGGLSGVGTTGIGIPESTDHRVSAYITMGSQPNGIKTTERTWRGARFFILLAYRVDRNQTTAETTLMGVVDALLTALYADPKLGGTCEGIEIDTGLADTPDYQLRAGKEYREYPIIVTARQYGPYTTGA